MAALSSSSSGLEVLEQAQTDTSIDSHHVAFCDAHDLIAIVSAGNNTESAVTVYRLKGEVAFTIALRDDEDLRPTSLRWKPDGSLLAVNWSDEVCCLYSGENGKLLYELPTRRTAAGDGAGWSLDVNAQDLRGAGADEAVPSSEDGIVSAPIIWTSFDDSGSKDDKTLQHDDELTTEDFFDHMTNGGPVKDPHPSPQRSDSAISALVNAITTLDTTTVLPRLSKIDTPTGMCFSPEGNKFSTQASTDTIFEASTFAPGIFSTLLTSDAKECVTVFVDETIKVGHIQLSTQEQTRTASHPRCPSQVILARSPGHAEKFHLNFIDLPLERLGSPLNYVVSLNTRRLQSLMAYITHTIRCVHQEIQTGIKGVSARLMKLLEEDLRSASPDSTPEDADTATLELQHLALTTSFHPVVLEWLKDIVKETGHKRWDQAVNAMYDHISRYIFTNLLPALQRFVAAVSALRGQARFHRHTGQFDVRLGVLDQLIEWADVLSLVAQRTLSVVTEEHAQFRAFSKWLRGMIDVAVAGPGSKGADETEEREAPNVDMDLCLRYIRGPLMHSMLKVFAESNPVGGRGGHAGMSKVEFFAHPVVVSVSRKQTVIALRFLDDPKQQKHQQQIPARSKDDKEQLHPSDPINLPLLTCLLKAHTRLAIDEVNTWQSQAVPRTPDQVTLDVGALERVWDMALYPTPPSTSSHEAAREIVQILGHSTTHEKENGPGIEIEIVRVQRQENKSKTAPPPPPPKIEANKIDLRGIHSILHAALLNRHESLVLAELASEDDQAVSSQRALILQGLDAPYDSQILHSWSGDGAFLSSPTHFVVGGRAGKRVVAVFSPAGPGARGTRWEVLDLEGTGSLGEQALEGAEDVEMD